MLYYKDSFDFWSFSFTFPSKAIWFCGVGLFCSPLFFSNFFVQDSNRDIQLETAASLSARVSGISGLIDSSRLTGCSRLNSSSRITSRFPSSWTISTISAFSFFPDKKIVFVSGFFPDLSGSSSLITSVMVLTSLGSISSSKVKNKKQFLQMGKWLFVF